MSFIIKDNGLPVVNTKLTNIGRTLLASGSLTFNKFEIGDSEIDYSFIEANSDLYDGSFYNILRPLDNNPTIKTPIKINNQTVDTKSVLNGISIEKIIVNTAEERGFFSSTTNNNYILKSGLTKYVNSVNIKSLTGGTNLIVGTNVTGLSINDYLLVNYYNPILSGNTIAKYNIAKNNVPFIWYKVLNITNNIIQVDRTLAKFNTNNTGTLNIYGFPSGNSITSYYGKSSPIAYWDNNSLSFNSNYTTSNDNVPVWNFNICYKDTILGTTSGYTSRYYNSQQYLGFLNYINGFYTGETVSSTVNDYKNALGILHYSNNSISNYYGESFNLNSLKLNIPTIMYHNSTGNTIGLNLKTKNELKQISGQNNSFIINYYPLIDDNSKQVGRVFNDLKIVTIEDQEILTALSYKSNRNWTLPEPTYYPITPLDTANPLIQNGYDTYIGYSFEDIGNYSGFTSNKSYGYSSTLPCQYIKKYTSNSSSENKDLQFKFNSNDFKFYSDSTDFINGTGFTATKFNILLQRVTKNTTIDSKNWKKIDYSSKLNSFNTWSGSTIPLTNLSDNYIYTLTNSDYNNGTNYSLESLLSIPTSSNYTTKLGFGEESFFFGNINVNSQAHVYKSSFPIKLAPNEYNISNNPSWDTTQSTYISEIGIYDNFNNLVAISKLGTPIEKKNGKFLMFQINIDF